MTAWWRAITCLWDNPLTVPVVVGLFYIILCVVILFIPLWNSHWKSYQVTWFMPKKQRWDTTELDWGDVRKILQEDPLEHYEGWRGAKFGKIAFDSMKVLGMMLVPILMIYWIPLYIKHVLYNSSLTSEVSLETLAVIIGIITLLVTVIVGFKSLQSKVRSENRQKWIDDLRNTVSEAIAFLFYYRRHEEGRGREPTDEALYRFDQQLIKLELLMNPSEKDHRVLGWMLRKCYRDGESIEPDKIFLSVEKMNFVADLNRKKDFELLISYIIRLSNAILKREWERVKYLK